MTFDLRSADPVYLERRNEIAAAAAGPHRPAQSLVYRPEEHRTWSVARRTLRGLWSERAAPEVVTADRRLDLPVDRVPQLSEVSAALADHGGFEFRAVAGLVPVEQFFGSLADGVFLSTQYLRHHGDPLYTPEPDIIHEVLGHGTCLADPDLALLHRQAGEAMGRLSTERARQFVADVFWFSAEFGVISSPTGPLAYGAGLLSSVGELQAMARAEIRPLDVVKMGTLPYDIDKYQPVLFAARSVGHAVDVVGRFFTTVTDDQVFELTAAADAA